MDGRQNLPRRTAAYAKHERLGMPQHIHGASLAAQQGDLFPFPEIHSSLVFTYSNTLLAHGPAAYFSPTNMYLGASCDNPTTEEQETEIKTTFAQRLPPFILQSRCNSPGTVPSSHLTRLPTNLRITID